MREAAGDDDLGVRGPAAPGRAKRARARGELQPALLSPLPARARADRPARDRRRQADLRPLPAGLVAARHGLELAPRAVPRRAAARGGGHRLALDGPDVV